MKKLIYSICFVLLFTNSIAQNLTDKSVSEQRPINQTIVLSQDIYLPGEDLHFSILRNKMNNEHIKVTCSLHNLSGNSLLSKSVEDITGRIEGDMKIPSDLEPGIYILTCKDKNDRLVAYEEVIVALPNNEIFDPAITFSKDNYEMDEQVKINFEINPKEDNDFRSARVKLRLFSGGDMIEKERFRVKAKTNDEFIYQLEEKVSDDVYMKGFIKVRGEKYEFMERIPFKKRHYNIDIISEGRVLKENSKNKVAVRIYSDQGTPLANKHVKLINSSDEVVKSFVTDALGHAFFIFIPEINETYSINLPEDECFESSKPLDLSKGKHKIQILSFSEDSTLFQIPENDLIIHTKHHRKSDVLKSSRKKGLNLGNNQYCHLLLSDKSNQVLSDLMFLNDAVILNAETKNSEDKFEVKLINDNTLANDQPLVFSVSHKDRMKKRINWTHYRLDYYLYPEFRNFLSQIDIDNPAGLTKLKFLISPFRENYNSEEALFRELQNQYPEFKRELLNRDLARNNVVIYADGSYAPPIKEKKPPYKKLLEEGVDVKEAVYAVKPYQNYQGNIIFSGMINSIKNQQGALIIVDGVKMGTSISILDNLNPRTIKSIEVHVDPGETLTHSGFASTGVVDIKTGEEYDDKVKVKEGDGLLSSNLYFNKTIPLLKNKNSRIIVPVNNKKGMFISFAFGYTKEGMPVIYSGTLKHE